MQPHLSVPKMQKISEKIVKASPDRRFYALDQSFLIDQSV